MRRQKGFSLIELLIVVAIILIIAAIAIPNLLRAKMAANEASAVSSLHTIFTADLFVLALLFGLATFAYAAFSTIANVLPSDLYTSESVASVSGMSGTAAGIGTIIAFLLIGHFSDERAAQATTSFDPIVVVAGLVPLVGMLLVLLRVRNTRAREAGLVRRL